MSLTRDVTELDFRLPEVRDAKHEDYEFRADGELVRKDRWETAIRRIVSELGLNPRHFEINEVSDCVCRLNSDDRSRLV